MDVLSLVGLLVILLSLDERRDGWKAWTTLGGIILSLIGWAATHP